MWVIINTNVKRALLYFQNIKNNVIIELNIVRVIILFMQIKVAV